MDMNFFNNANLESLSKQLEMLDPAGTLNELGLSKQSVSKVLAGDMSPIGEDLAEPQELDFNQICEVHGKYFNKSLIEMFFQKALNENHFTDEEIEIYSDAYNKWFDLVFNIGKLNIFYFDDAPESPSLAIRVDEILYVMTKYKNFNLILKA